MNMSLLKIMSTLILFILALFHVYSADPVCDPLFELQCDDGSCIEKGRWCDSIEDCIDTSDEKYCSGAIPCRQRIHFECYNKQCIPASAICDTFNDCEDGSDEKNCNSSVGLEYDTSVAFNTLSQNFSLATPKLFPSTDEIAIDKAVKYLLNTRSSDYGWGPFTPRAVVALSMASRVSSVARKNKQMMVKQLNIHIIKDLMRNRNTTLSNLALYINALYATCQDPRNFHGMDLVAQLRRETDIAVKSKTSIPLAFLTLCLSNATRYDDNLRLTEFYNSRDFGKRTGSRALTVLAMICVHRKDTTTIFREYISDFFTEEVKNAKTADIYTKALFKQASIAAKISYPGELVNKQLPDGSFGDMLSTYYAIPILLNSSLLDLVCSTQSKGLILANDDKAEGTSEVTYSLWITSGKDPISHSTTVRFYGKKSVFDIMTMAAARDPLYRFQYEELDPEGKKVYSLAGIPNDIESGTSWSLYFTDADNVKVNSLEGLTLMDEGVDKYYPNDKWNLIFWFKRSLNTNRSFQEL